MALGIFESLDLLKQQDKRLCCLIDKVETELSAEIATKVTNQLGVPSMRADLLTNLPAPGETGRMYISTDTYAFYRDNGTGWDLIGGPGIGTVTGSGTTNYLSKWSGSTTLGNSLLWDNGTKDISLGAASALSLGSNLPTLNLVGLSDAFTGGIYFRSSANAVKGYIYGTSSLFSIGSETSVPLTFQTAATERARIFANGNFAIGTSTDAGYKLDVSGSLRVTTDVYLATSWIGHNVGVGTTSPSYKLDVVRVDNSVNPIINIGNNWNGTGSRAIMQFSSSTATGQVGTVSNSFTAVSTINANETYLLGTHGIVIHNNSTTAPIRFFTNASEKMRLDANGNVGIGTTSPTYKLDVSGNFRFSNLSTAAILGGASNTEIIQFDALSLSGAGRMIWTNTAFYFRAGTGADLSLGSNNTNDRMIIKSGGNVLIGTTTDGGYKLDVNGSSRTSGSMIVYNSFLNVHNSNGSGYNLTMSSEYSYDPFIRFSYGSGLNPLSPSRTDWLQVGNENITLGFGNNINLNFVSGGVTRFMLTRTSYNFLIGTTTDAGYKLDVNGTARVNSVIFSSNANQRIIEYNNISGLYLQNTAGPVYLNGTMTVNRTGDVYINNNQAGSRYISLTSSYRINTNDGLGSQFGLNIGADGTRVMQIFNGGNVAFEKAIDYTSTNNASALVSINSTTQGFLPPRMTGAQAEAIATPAAGLLVYANNGNGVTITTTGWWGYDGATWVKLN